MSSCNVNPTMLKFEVDDTNRKQLRAFETEKKAFEIVKNVKELQHRVPAFFGQQLPVAPCEKDMTNTKALGFEFIKGKTVSELPDQLFPGDLGKIYKELRRLLQILHRHGIAHNDTHTRNVMIRDAPIDHTQAIEERIVLLDFSHSTLKSELRAEESWEAVKEADYE